MFPAANPRAHWIPPEEQLKRLRLSIAKEVPRLTTDLANIVAQGAIDDSVTNWYTALSRLNALPEKIPPLPEHIYQILDSQCPIYGDRKIRDTHFLALIPEEFGNLNRFEGEVLRPYGEREYPERENPLQFRDFWDLARQEHADVPFAPTHWILMTKDVLPGSDNKSWEEQLALVEALSRKALANYEILTLQESVVAITLYRVVTGEKLYQVGAEQNRWVSTFTRVQETTRNWRLIVGDLFPPGVNVHSDYICDGGTFGVAALRKF